jgi:protein-S-isoprenylcysteine O-methyltransferase Ste14
VKSTVAREPMVRRLSHIVPMVMAALLLLWPLPLPPILGVRWLPQTLWSFWLGALLTLAGLLFAAWARVHIGSNWSGIVTIKQGHELITTGPYALVRHPIYTGLSAAFLGSAVALGESRGLLALVLVVGSFWMKLKFEERWMRRQFGRAYDEYAGRVRALIPFVL